MNKVILIGRTVEQPELKSTQSGVSVCSFRIAVNRRSDRDKSDFFTVVTWRGLAENCAAYLTKGQQIAVCGELQTRSYEGKDGNKRYLTEISAEEIEFMAKAKGGDNLGGIQDLGDDDLPY